MTRFDEFVKERKYLKNVSPRTLDYYEDCRRAWEKHGPDPKEFIVKMREGGARVIREKIIASHSFSAAAISLLRSSCA